MGRHPYTYSADLIRSWAGYNESGTKLSRADASRIIEGFAMVLGLTEEELSEQLSLYYQKHQQEITDTNIERLKQKFLITARMVDVKHIDPIDEDDYRGADHD